MITLDELAIERPVGSENNNKVLRRLDKEATSLGYEVVSLPTRTQLWHREPSFIRQNGVGIELFPSPFSRPFFGSGRLARCSDWSDLDGNPESILVLQEPMTREALMPLGFPVYFPLEHQEKYDRIRAASPKCLITETGKHKMSGLDPYPFFEDGNFPYPSAYKGTGVSLDFSQDAFVVINSRVEEVDSSQLIFKKKGETDAVILVCAHMDSKYDTTGALDNAAGLLTLVNLLKMIHDTPWRSTIHVVPFNGEENYGIPGQLKYQDYIGHSGLTIRAVINIDSPGFVGSRNAVSFYHIECEKQKVLLGKTRSLEQGAEWYAGDHSMFAFRGIPCVVATSSNLFEVAIDYTHTPRDTPHIVDPALIADLSADLLSIIREIDSGLLTL